MGLRKKESPDLFLRKLGKCLWEYLILSLVLAKMDLKKLFKKIFVSRKSKWKGRATAVKTKPKTFGDIYN